MEHGDNAIDVKQSEAVAIASRLARWYGQEGRQLPWRAPPGVRPDPYAVWLSEVMLQQTTVKVVIPYYMKFIDRWPTVETLGMAASEEVMSAWAGLGYYSRARNLLRTARIVAHQLDGRFPETVAALQELPGIGPSTAAAIAAIAFNLPAVVVDGNVERVIARLFAIRMPLGKAKAELRRIAAKLAPTKHPGDFAQAMMDLGATVCTPRNPSCGLCPLTETCAARATGHAAALPTREIMQKKPLRWGVAFFVLRDDGAVLLRKRPDEGLLGAMLEVPSAGWNYARGKDDRAGDASSAPFEGDWCPLPGRVRHTFTHFHLELTVFCTSLPAGHAPAFAPPRADWRWVARQDLGSQALPSLMRKVVAHGFEHMGAICEVPR